MLSAKELKKKLTLDDYRTILNMFGAEPDEHDECWTCYTICHNLNVEKGVSKKLYFYLDTRSFMCFTGCNESFDVIGLVQKRFDLEGKIYTFTDILQWIMSAVGLSNESFELNQTTNRLSWENSLKCYKERKKSTYLGKVYDKQGLNLCLPYYHKYFLDDNISVETMQKFNIGWYAPQSQITIPVFSDSGELLGIHCRNTKKELLDKGYKYIPLKTANEHYRFKTSEVLYGININKPWIEKSKQVFLFESQKSVLQCDTFGVHNALALFGMNCSQHQRNTIIKMGVNEIIICLDRQYISTDSVEFERYAKNVTKIAKLFKGHAKVYSMTDMENLLGYKDSPSDCGKEVFDILYKNKFKINP